MKVVIRADASRSLGVGHAMRCWALAEEFSLRGASVTWCGTFDVPWLRSALDARGWPVESAKGHGRNAAREIDADWVVIDSYVLDEHFRLALMGRGIGVLVIVDDSHADFGPASLWVNPGAPLELPCGSQGTSLDGPDYVLIRRKIRELGQERRARIEHAGPEDRITVLLGGTDSAGLGRALTQLRDIPVEWPALIAGPGAGPCNEAVTWLSGGEGLMKAAAISRLVVTTAGLSSWELAHIGVPMGIVQVADNQAGNYRFMTSNGWAWPMGQVSHFQDTPAFIEQVGRAWHAALEGALTGVSTVDGLGAARVVDRVLQS